MNTLSLPFSKNAIVKLTGFVLNNYSHIRSTIDAGIEFTKKTYQAVKITTGTIYSLFTATAEAMQAVENEGALKGLQKKEAVLIYIQQEYVAAKAELKAVWSTWATTLSWFIDQLITLLNAGRNVMPVFAG